MWNDLREFALKHLAGLVVWIAEDPSSFFLALFVCLTPLLVISSVLSWKLHKAIVEEKKRTRRRERLDRELVKAKKKN
ncbi:hypothetical protein AB6A40_009310 [Gnathostoma spinigerum]|uniref:Small integral membrane protein 15 n=1 Tax=Gnathostoma spinigerum TaxID=75299 RepID=A0ABD6EYR3_9BILA